MDRHPPIYKKSSLGMKCMKIILILINVLYLIISFLMISGATTLKVIFGDHYFELWYASTVDSLSSLWIATGVFLLALSIFGIAAAVKESTMMTNFYGVFLSLIFVLQMAAAITGFTLITQSNGIVWGSLNSMMYQIEYNYESGTMDWIQKTFECCGNDAPSDWERFGKYATTTPRTTWPYDDWYPTTRPYDPWYSTYETTVEYEPTTAPPETTPVLSNIVPAHISRKESALRECQKILNDMELPICGDILAAPTTSRLKSRKPFWHFFRKMDELGNLKNRWREWWRNADVVNKQLISDPTQVVKGTDLPRRLNRIRTGQGNCAFLLHRWQIVESSLCQCGEIQTIDHIVSQCAIHRFSGNISEIHAVTENARHWLENLAIDL